VIRDYLVAFDDFVTQSPVYTSDVLNGTLGLYDQIGIQAVLDNVPSSGGNGTLSLRIQHSPDGHVWTDRSATPEIDPATNVTHPNQVNVHSGDSGVFPGLPFVRFRIDLGGAITKGHLRVHAVMRDPAD
jgi:hypothetical protein